MSISSWSPGVRDSCLDGEGAEPSAEGSADRIADDSLRVRTVAALLRDVDARRIAGSRLGAPSWAASRIGG